jgi:hypothetical protein
MTAGLLNSDLIIVAARPSMGKDAFALTWRSTPPPRAKSPCPRPSSPWKCPWTRS